MTSTALATLQDNPIATQSEDQIEQAKKLAGAVAVQTVEDMLPELEKFREIIANKIIRNDQDSGDIGDGIKRAKIYLKRLTDLRGECSGVHLARQKSVLSWFNQFIDIMDAAIKAGNANQTHYLQEKQRLQREQARIAQEAAAKEAREKAEELKRKADEAINVAVDDTDAYDQGSKELALEDAEVAEAHADIVEAQEVSAPAVTGVGTGFSKTKLTYTYSAKVVDVAKIPARILNKPKVIEAINKILSAEAKTDKDTFAIEGAELIKTAKTTNR